MQQATKFALTSIVRQLNWQKKADMNYSNLNKYTSFLFTFYANPLINIQDRYV